jgi:tetratricopeptide (TPR) repeat protein
MSMKISALIAFATIVLVVVMSGRACALGLPFEVGDHVLGNGWAVRAEAAMKAGDLLDAKSDYESALAAVPGSRSFKLGLARCNVALADYADAVTGYKDLLQLDSENVDLLSEYSLALQGVGDKLDAISNYNEAVGWLTDVQRSLNSKHIQGPFSDVPYLPTFKADGSDYDPGEMAGLVHVMKGLHASGDDEATISSEREKALAAAPNSPVVAGYADLLLRNAKEARKIQEGEQITKQDHGDVGGSPAIFSPLGF